jgi:hypothetical protein
MRDITDEVASVLVNGPLRGMVRAGLTTLLQARMHELGTAQARMHAARVELASSWRIHQGGPLGSPTPTRDLVAIAQVLQADVKNAEEALLKIARLFDVHAPPRFTWIMALL